ncbi:hypothetical protein M758_1G100200 [Ceratodon purpureus]|uniref:Uncharacterized protein n=1 Tax=Ceratodon purpureus TaxID=3225 RepID=A0A8T0J4V8_CERPU|nr:hypothetical protein KC19_1G111000 [Ceratodon purpureus]KAG0629392.1 hypothetical protein M758_1G100200 [Ceratodon purpureus]
MSRYHIMFVCVLIWINMSQILRWISDSEGLRSACHGGGDGHDLSFDACTLMLRKART